MIRYIFLFLIAVIALNTGCNKSVKKITMNEFTAQDLKTEKDSLSFAYGVFIAEQLKSQGLKDINAQVLSKAIDQQMTGSNEIMTLEMARTYIGEQQSRMKGKAEAENKLAAAAFLAENGRRAGVTTTASGLQYEVINSGDGPSPTITSNVKTHYHGTLLSGEVFDSSVERGEPISFKVNGVIKGWTEALQLMKVGDKWKLFIPSDLAYGTRGAGGKIGPNAALIFEVELLGIE